MTRPLIRATATLIAVLAALLAAAVASPVSAQQAPAPSLEVQVSFDPPVAKLGQRTTLIIAVNHDSSLLISASEPRPSAALDLIESVPPITEPSEEGLLTVFRYVMAGFELGELKPGAFRVSWLAEDGRSGSITPPSPPLVIASTIVAGDEQLRPLKPQASVEGAPPGWQRPAGGGVLALALLGIVAWIWLHRREGRPATPGEERRDGPEERVRRRLDRLHDAELLQQGDFAGYYGTISAAVRGYIEERFAFRAMAMTTVELEARMEDRGVERWQARLVGGLLERCDAAVYARRRPDPASADHDLTVAFEIVELSRPRPSVAPAPVTPA
jgi:hypothetical protein